MQDDTLRASVVQLGNDVDRTALVWKGAAVLGKMEGVSELWVTPADWVRFSSGFRGWSLFLLVSRAVAWLGCHMERGVAVVLYLVELFL